jgi:hypothetical protein
MSGRCHGVLGLILMLFGIQVKDQVILDSHKLCWTFQNSFFVLMDISLVDGNFTWSNNPDSQSWSRIDRFLLSLEWEEQFLDVS